MTRVLIVDDEQSICWGLAELVQEMGYEALTAASAEEAFEIARQTPPDAILLDVRLPGMDGLQAMEKFRQILGAVPIIVMTAYGELATAVTAVRNGASDYITKPFDLRSAEKAIGRALASPGKRPSNTRRSRTASKKARSSALRRPCKRSLSGSPWWLLRKRACISSAKVAPAKSWPPEPFTATAGARKAPSLPSTWRRSVPSLAESELFGHVRGAFTGAEETRKGLLEQAHGGVIFLDEVADIPMTLQVKLLRSLEQGEVLPVGANRPVHADFRVISATHQTLSELVARGEFRHDLYFRLVAFEIEMPPLRERPEDIAVLAERFLNLIVAKTGQTPPSISPEAIAELERLPWYGNARELRNAIEHATVLARNGTITPEHLPPPAPANLTAAAVREDAVRGPDSPMDGSPTRRLSRSPRSSRTPPPSRRTAHANGVAGPFSRPMRHRRTPSRLAPHHPSQETGAIRGRPRMRPPHLPFHRRIA